MKSKIVLSLFSALLFIVLCSNSGGYGSNNRTGATGTSGCFTCHGSTSGIGTTVELDSAGIPVSSYRAGQVYRVRIKAVNNTGLSLPRFGMQLSTVLLANAGTGSAAQAGTWGALPAGLQNSGGTVTLIQHNMRLSPISGTGANGTIYCDSVLWTAPSAGTGSIRIYGVINAVNNNGNDDNGDKYQVATPVTITEAVTTFAAHDSIHISGGTNPACAGSTVTFTVIPVNGGAAPSYQWKVNGTNSGTNSPIFSSAGLSTGQIVTCVMTSNLAGVTGNPATSNSITMTVNPLVVPVDTLSASATTICAGSAVTFTSHPVNGGTAPFYQWKVNGANAGSNSATFSSASLGNGAIVSCLMTSGAACASPASVMSDSLHMVVNPILVPADTITALNTSICAGSPASFTVVPVNGGASPGYQWKVNGSNVGSKQQYITSSALSNGAVVSCIMTSHALCASPASSASNTITMMVTPIAPATITISNNSVQCIGSPDTFSAQITNGGLSPSFQWKKNGANTGSNSSSFISSSLAAGDSITCTLTSSSACASPAVVTSHAAIVTFSAPVIPSVSITTPADTICQSTSITFTAAPVNGGSNPVYQWKLNGLNAGNNTNTFTSSTFANHDSVTCIMTSNAFCVSVPAVNANTIKLTVRPTVTPTALAVILKDTICQGANAGFTVSGANLGTAPAYQWMVNGTNAGTNSSVYTTTTINNGDVVNCLISSSAVCPLPAQVLSNSITMTVHAPAAGNYHTIGHCKYLQWR